MEDIKNVINSVLEKHGPIESRDQLCTDLTEALVDVKASYYYRHLTETAKRLGYDGIASALMTLSNLRDDEEIGRLADTVDNLLGAEAIPMDENLAKGARCGALTTLRDQLREIHVRITGDNPWEGA